MSPGPRRSALVERIRSEALEAGPLTFARFMELALYDPEAGYYAAGAARLGPGGDFITASDVGTHLGRALARQLADLDLRCGPLEPFHLVDFGCGRGLLSRDIMDALARTDPDLHGRVHPILVDRSEAMRAEAKRRVPEATVLSPLELRPGLQGCVLAVELFDALPVHRLRRRDGCLVEVRVGAEGTRGGLLELEAPPEGELAELANRYGAASGEGTEAEVAPSAADAIRAMGTILDRGIVIVIDYGDRADALYGRRPHGTLLAYREHRTGEDFLEWVGEQDLTAHVNFSLLEDEARARGFDILGLTTQDRFLISCGILDCFAGSAAVSPLGSAAVKERLRALQLIHPHGMGRAFKVLVLSKGVPPPPVLSGLRDPFERVEVEAAVPSPSRTSKHLGTSQTQQAADEDSDDQVRLEPPDRGERR